MRGAIRSGAAAWDPPGVEPIDPSVLGCVVTGFAKGGTTLAKDLLVQTTAMESGFEGGLLLTDEPSQGIPEPHATILRTGWLLQPGFDAEYRRCRSHEEGYRLLRLRAGSVKRRDQPLVDKLPQYMPVLPEVMRRAPGTPVVVALRDPVHVAVSWVQQGERLDAAVAWMRTAVRGFLAAARDEGSMRSIYVCNLADLVGDADAELARIQRWLGMPVRPHDPATGCGLPYLTASTHRTRLGGVERDRHDMAGRCTPEQLAEIGRTVRDAIPETPHLAACASGPLRTQRERHAMVGPGDLWESKRAFQIGFLHRRGLRRSDRLLDLGCGTLRGGIPIIEYLDRGGYVGVDIRPETIREARLEVLHHGVSAKEPTLAEAASLGEAARGRPFDVVWAFAALIHMDDATLDRALEAVRTHLRPGGHFYGNVHVAPSHDSTWQGLPMVWRPLEHYRRAFEAHGMQVEDIGSLAEFGHVHPRHGPEVQARQRMLHATVPGG